jgi:hypothetical protein
MKKRRLSNTHSWEEAEEPYKQIYLQSRDIDLFEDIYAYGGALTLDQLLLLHFPSKKVARDRLGDLFRADYLKRTSRRGSALIDAVGYALTERSMIEAAGRQGEKKLPPHKWSAPNVTAKLNHDIYINDFVIDTKLACETFDHLTLHEWVSEQNLRAMEHTFTYKSWAGDTVKNAHAYPDSILIVDRDTAEDYRGRFLMEMDMSNHSNPTFGEEKIVPYIAYIRSPIYKRRFGDNTGRVLVVVPDTRRIKYLAETARRYGGKNARIWHFAAIDAINYETIFTEKIWTRADQEEKVALIPKEWGEKDQQPIVK